MVKLLLKWGADLSAVDLGGRTALHEAACNGQKSVVQLLFVNGADVSTTDNAGKTALYEAWSQGHTPVVQLLQIDENSQVAVE